MLTRGYADAASDGIRTKHNMPPPLPPTHMVGGHNYCTAIQTNNVKDGQNMF